MCSVLQGLWHDLGGRVLTYGYGGAVGVEASLNGRSVGPRRLEGLPNLFTSYPGGPDFAQLFRRRLWYF